MPHFEIECLERFTVKTIYKVEAADENQAKSLVTNGEVAYDELTAAEDGNDEFVSIVKVECI